MKYDILKNLIYILQSEHYDRKRFLIFSYKNFFKLLTFSKRGDISWTLRAKEEYFLSFFFIILSILVIYFNFSLFWAFLIPASLPIYVFSADIFISPYIKYKKNKIHQKAKNILEKSNIQVVGITGSYGKTTAKNILESVLSEKFKVLKTPGNINTDMGVANFVIENKEKLNDFNFLILEMGAYRIGDIQLLCDITRPDYSLTIAIGKSHLERFGSQENITTAKFELSQNTVKHAFLNGCNKNIQKNYKTFLKDSNGFDVLCEKKVLEKSEYLEAFSGLSFVYQDMIFETKLLAKHNIMTFILVIELAKEVGMDMEQIRKGLASLDNIEHRLSVIKNTVTGVTVIDDSYNGNLDGFMSGIEVIKNAQGRKIVLTPGIVELGESESMETHKKLAEQYSKNIDMVLLVENQNTKIIQEYFNKHNFSKYKVYKTVEKAHADLANVLKKGDTIIFQNDLPDNYN